MTRSSPEVTFSYSTSLPFNLSFLHDPASMVSAKTPVLIKFDFNIWFYEVFGMWYKLQVFNGDTPAEPLLFIIGLDSQNFICIGR